MVRDTFFKKKFDSSEMNLFELLLFQTPIKENVWLISYRMLTLMFTSKVKLIVTMIVFIYSGVQILWFIYRMYSTNSDVIYFCNYIPITMTLYFPFVSIIQVAQKRAEFNRCCTYIENNFWPVSWAPKEAKEEMDEKIGSLKKLFLVMVVVSVFDFFPFDGLAYYKNLFPIEDILNYFDMPKALRFSLECPLYLIIFPMSYYITIVASFLACFVSCYMTQTILIRWILINITTDLESIHQSPSDIVDDNVCQQIIGGRLKKIIRQHRMLVRFAKMIQDFSYYIPFWHIGGAIGLMGNLLFIILGNDSAKENYVAVTKLLLASIVSVLTYCFMGQLIENQMSEIFDAILVVKWYNFNVKNRKLFLIFVQNANRLYPMYAGRIMPVNQTLAIWIFSKAFGLVSIFAAIKE